VPIDSVSLSAPAGLLVSFVRWLLPPVVEFGSPSQRAKDANESFWHIPVTVHRKFGIGPGEIPRAQIFLDVYENGQATQTIRLAWGDAVFTNIGESSTLVIHEKLLVPIAQRSETANDRLVGVASLKHLMHKTTSERLVAPDRKKFRFRLRLKAGKRNSSSTSSQ
jgi:hypothetical protein